MNLPINSDKLLYFIILQPNTDVKIYIIDINPLSGLIKVSKDYNIETRK